MNISTDNYAFRGAVLGAIGGIAAASVLMAGVIAGVDLPSFVAQEPVATSTAAVIVGVLFGAVTGFTRVHVELKTPADPDASVVVAVHPQTQRRTLRALEILSESSDPVLRP